MQYGSAHQIYAIIPVGTSMKDKKYKKPPTFEN